MTQLKKLEYSEIAANINNWEKVESREAIIRKLVFKDFVHAFAFMTKIAIFAEKMNHHPEWFNVYNRLEIILTTHDVDGLSQNDIEMAKVIDDLFING